MRLIIIGDLEGQMGAASKIAKDRGAKVTLYSTLDMTLDAIRKGNGGELILVDVKDDIETLVSSLRNEHIHIPVVACGFETNTREAVKAIKAGAMEYIPLPPQEDLIAAVLEAISADNHTLIYRSAAMKTMVQLAEQVAPSDANILITGESGTGKEVFARHIHQKSSRASKPFISVNCAAIPENLLESELFGHEKGAFTGAVARRIGKFEEANHGTLLLDEISEMDFRLQAKLLRAIQEQEIDRVGGKTPVKVNLRILATSNRDLPEEVKKGNFREDLYFRLNVINLCLPPLRERKEDITPLAEHFVKKYSEANGLPVRPLDDTAIRKLEQYEWPGNVRELENTLHRAVLLATGETITESAILLTNQMSGGGAALFEEEDNSATGEGPAVKSLVGRTVASVERDLILETLEHCMGNRTHAANILGISIRTLRNKLKEYSEGSNAAAS